MIKLLDFQYPFIKNLFLKQKMNHEPVGFNTKNFKKHEINFDTYNDLNIHNHNVLALNYNHNLRVPQRRQFLGPIFFNSGCHKPDPQHTSTFNELFSTTDPFIHSYFPSKCSKKC
jgi:hypothetical protein